MPRAPKVPKEFKAVNAPRRWVDCPACGGTGEAPDSVLVDYRHLDRAINEKPCGPCMGTGEQLQEDRGLLGDLLGPAPKGA